MKVRLLLAMGLMLCSKSFAAVIYDEGFTPSELIIYEQAGFTGDQTVINAGDALQVSNFGEVEVFTRIQLFGGGELSAGDYRVTVNVDEERDLTSLDQDLTVAISDGTHILLVTNTDNPGGAFVGDGYDNGTHWAANHPLSQGGVDVHLTDYQATFELNKLGADEVEVLDELSGASFGVLSSVDLDLTAGLFLILGTGDVNEQYLLNRIDVTVEDIAPVPVPPAVVLLAMGLFAVFGARKMVQPR
ncbi:MAG: hypothetical protein AAF525_16505 [Pseudomonadota bacterium]